MSIAASQALTFTFICVRIVVATLFLTVLGSRAVGLGRKNRIGSDRII